MIQLTLPQYEDYLNQRLNILVSRSMICQKVLKMQAHYDYWTFNYAYYLYCMNAESLNHLRYLFRGSAIYRIDFYDLLTLSYLKIYLKMIITHPLPAERLHQTMTALFSMPVSRISFILPNFSLATMPPFKPSPAFHAYEDELEQLIKDELALQETYPEI